MTIYIALLRGINVSGKNVMKMAELKSALSTLELEDLQSYVQSGNLVFRSEEKDTHAISKRISREIQRKFDYQVAVKVIGREEFHHYILENPFLENPLVDAKKLYYINLFDKVDEKDFYELVSRNDFDEELVLHKSGQIAYVHYKNGYGRSKLTHRYFENKLKVFVTARNHNTMTKLNDLSKNQLT